MTLFKPRGSLLWVCRRMREGREMKGPQRLLWAGVDGTEGHPDHECTPLGLMAVGVAPTAGGGRGRMAMGKSS